MTRSIFVAAVLCVACTHREHVPLDAVTTTSATIRTDRGAMPLEPIATNDQNVASMPSQIPSNAADDTRIATAVEAYDDAAVARAKFAMGRATDPRVRDLAQMIYDRHHESKMRLSTFNATPGPVEVPTALHEAVGPSPIDFDRVYTETEAREESALLQLIDHATPEARTVELRSRLMDLRAKVADLWVRSVELSQTLAVNAP